MQATDQFLRWTSRRGLKPEAEPRIVCSVLVCLRCDASRAETLPRGRAIDAQRSDQLGGGIWRLELEDG